MADAAKKKTMLMTGKPSSQMPVPLLNGLPMRDYRYADAAGTSSGLPGKKDSVTVNLGQAAPGTAASAATDLRLRSGGANPYNDQRISNIITSFKKPQFTAISRFLRELRCVFKDFRAKKALYLTGFNLVSTFALFTYGHHTNSLVLLAYTYLSVFHLFILLTCPLSVWVDQQRPSASFTFGYGRFEVLAVFSCTVLAIVGALFIVKECVTRLLLPQQPAVNGNGLLTCTGMALMCQLVVIYGMDSKAWTHVLRSANSSCLQVRLTEISENLCQFMPGLSRVLLPRINPFVLLANSGATLVVVSQLFVEFKGSSVADTIAAILMSFLTWITMLPICNYTGMILLQTTPSHVLSHLEKCLREAATLDGVLEFRNEHFWTLTFGVMAGSLHVRIRRDANEQLVLSHLTSRLSSLIHVLTIQVFKDDWTRSTTTTLQLLTEPTRTSLAWMSNSKSSAAAAVAQSDFSTLSIFSEKQRSHLHPLVAAHPADALPSYPTPRV